MKTRALIALWLLITSWSPQQETSRATYLNGEAVAFEIAPPAVKDKSAGFGPWKLGAQVAESKPHDGRLNLYIAIPGDDFQSADDAQSLYDHNRVINMAPPEKENVVYDVYWALALEPHVNRDFHSESELLEAAQKRFLPGDLYEIRDAPAADFMREMLKLDSLDDLKPFRRRDGTLPTLIILPAGYAVRGSALR
jgi:hypothetical protein